MGRGLGLAVRGARASRGARERVEASSSVSIHTVADYLPVGLTQDIWTYGRTPEFTIIRVDDGRDGYEAIQYAPHKSVVLLAFGPEEGNSRRLFNLLHELGHIGPVNLHAGGSWLGTHGGSLGALLAAFGCATPGASTPVIIAWGVCLFVLAFLPQWTDRVRRLRAEVEADHFAILAATRIVELDSRMRLDRTPLAIDGLGPDRDPALEVVLTVDTKTWRVGRVDANDVRKSVFDVMREHVYRRILLKPFVYTMIARRSAHIREEVENGVLLLVVVAVGLILPFGPASHPLAFAATAGLFAALFAVACATMAMRHAWARIKLAHAVRCRTPEAFKRFARDASTTWPSLAYRWHLRIRAR
jgi:hypothetical protein